MGYYCTLLLISATLSSLPALSPHYPILPTQPPKQGIWLSDIPARYDEIVSKRVKAICKTLYDYAQGKMFQDLDELNVEITTTCKCNDFSLGRVATGQGD